MGDNDRLAAWARKKIDLREMRRVKSILRKHDLNTVCESARCPNQSECFGRGQATFMIMGDVCTRGCAFCAVKKGVPMPLDPEEPKRVAKAARALELKHVVVTSVTRDDIEDHGASHCAKTVRFLREVDCVETTEVLASDLGGKRESLMTVLASQPDVFNHNVETVPRLYPNIRPQADYGRSLRLIEWASQCEGARAIKSGFMVGFGEKTDEVKQMMRDLKSAGCSIVTIGQYLRPSVRNIPVAEYVLPRIFESYEEFGRKMGLDVIASPLVRSSYRADLFARRFRGADPDVNDEDSMHDHAR